MSIAFGELEQGLEVETEPVVVAAKELDRLGLDAMQKASLFGNVTALFCMKARLSRRQYLELMHELWETTETQMALMELPTGSPLKAGVA
jgi:hypothetical protein